MGAATAAEFDDRVGIGELGERTRAGEETSMRGCTWMGHYSKNTLLPVTSESTVIMFFLSKNAGCASLY